MKISNRNQYIQEDKNIDIIIYENSYTGERNHWQAKLDTYAKKTWIEEDHTLDRNVEVNNNMLLSYTGTSSELSSIKRIYYKCETKPIGTTTSDEMVFEKESAEKNIYIDNIPFGPATIENTF